MSAAQVAIGVDIGGTRTKYGLVVTSTGEVLHTIVEPTEKKSEAAFLHQVGLAVEQLLNIAQSCNRFCNGIGFGVPGYVHANGIVDSTYGFLEFMEDYPLVELIVQKFNTPCRIDNDARVVALGEALYGVGKEFERVLVLTLGTGLGFGMVVNGAFPDILPFAHMGGHISITENGEPCYCGKTGCLEALVSSQGIIHAANKLKWKEKYPDIPASAEAIFDAAKSSNPHAQEIVAELITYLDTGIQNYINLFAPDIIVLGGGISKGLVPYIDQLNKNPYLKPYKSYHVKIAVSVLEEQAGIAGAAALFTNNR